MKSTSSAGGVPSLSVASGIATIQLNRPEQHNRLDPDDLPVICDLSAAACKNISVRLLVITGAGQKTFCSGYTLDAIVSRLDDSFEQMLDTLEACPLPTLAALNGSAYGGAIDLALCCDFRIAVANTAAGPLQAMMPAARFGLHYHPGGLRRFTEQLGLSAAKKMLLTAQTLYADELLANNFLTELVVDQVALDSRIQAYAQALQACEIGAIKSMKAQLNAIARDAASPAAKDRSAYVASLVSPELKSRLNKRLQR